MQENIIQKLEAEMLAHIGACCLERLTTAWVDYANPLLHSELAKHAVKVVGATNGADALAQSELIIATTPPNAHLREDCVVLLPLANLLSDFENALKTLQGLGERFSILMPFVLWNLPHWFVFCSCRIHPLASLSLQRAELLDGLLWYSASMHQSAFVLPPNLTHALRHVVKN